MVSELEQALERCQAKQLGLVITGAPAADTYGYAYGYAYSQSELGSAEHVDPVAPTRERQP